MKLLMLEVDDIVSTFASALPAVIGTIQGVLAAGDEDSLLSLLEDLDSCVEWVHAMCLIIELLVRTFVTTYPQSLRCV